MDFFGLLITKIQETGFAPLAPLEKSKATYTLHNVVRDAIGMADRQEIGISNDDAESLDEDRITETHITADNADVAYWDYKVLRKFLVYVHELLNNEVSKQTNRQGNAIAWSHEPTRTQNEVIDLFMKLQKQFQNLEVPSQAIKRPSAKGMVQNKRVEAAVANTMAVLVANGSDYGDLFDQIAELEYGNEELLDYLDSLIDSGKANRELVDNKSVIPRQLVVSYVKYRDSIFKIDSKFPTICSFISAINTTNNLAGNSETTLVDRLVLSSAKAK